MKLICGWKKNPEIELLQSQPNNRELVTFALPGPFLLARLTWLPQSCIITDKGEAFLATYQRGRH